MLQYSLPSINRLYFNHNVYYPKDIFFLICFNLILYEIMIVSSLGRTVGSVGSVAIYTQRSEAIVSE